MAFVRWRKNCAELLATVYENGKSRQILLANLPDPYTRLETRLQVAAEHPELHIDWLAVERELAKGPKTAQRSDPPMTMLQAEVLLRDLAQQLASDPLMHSEVTQLDNAAVLLFIMRTDSRFSDLSQRANVTSDDGARPPPSRAPETAHKSCPQTPLHNAQHVIC